MVVRGKIHFFSFSNISVVEPMNVNLKVKTLDYVPSLEEFVQNYSTPGVPVVIKNGISSNNLWDLQFLVDQVGHRDVPVRKNTSHENYKVCCK